MHFPTSEQELASIIKAASDPVKIVGGGTRQFGRPVLGDEVSLSKLSGIRLYEPGALTIVAGAGTAMSEITSCLDEHNQQLAFEPMDHRGILDTSGTPTIGGAIATNTSGPRRISAGAARDFLLGVRFVDGMGNVVKNGGRVMKNVTGYDLVKLLAGSCGTLGVISEVSLKVLPKPETESTVAVQARSPKCAVDIMSSAMGSPYDVTGAAFDPQSETVYLRVEGFPISVEYRRKKLMQHLVEFGRGEYLDMQASKALWEDLRDVKPLQKTKGDIWRISVKPSDAPNLLDRINAEQFLLDWAGGLAWVLSRPGENLRDQMGGMKGHATLVRATNETRQRIASFYPEPAAIFALSSGLRSKFDPRGILNRGLMT